MKGIVWMFLVGALAAQDVPLQRPEEREATRRQSQAFFEGISPLARDAGASTVFVWATVPTRSGPKREWVATGTVVGDGAKVLTKWSQISFADGGIWCVGGDGTSARASVLGVYPEEDVALLQLEEETRFTPLEWSREEAPGLGSFLIAAGPEGSPLGFGVVAVEERVLSESGQGFLGVQVELDEERGGVRVASLDERGRAGESGVSVGDLILEVEGREIGSAFELRNSLLDSKPGDVVTLKLSRDGEVSEVEVELQPRPKFGGIPESRLRQMRGMGTRRSVISDGFPLAIQTDMRLDPETCGGPVVNLDGEVVGMTIARADRTRSFILPASRIEEILGREPEAPELAQIDPVRPQAPAPRAVPMDPGAERSLRGSIEEISGFLERMRREMEGVGE